MDRGTGRARRRGLSSSRRFPRLHLGRRDLREPGRGGALRLLQEVRELVRGGFCDRSGGLPRPELPPTSFLEDLEGAGELASKGIVGGAVGGGRHRGEFPANRDESEG